MARIYNTFEFVGNLNLPKDDEKFHRVNKKDSGWEGHTIRFAVNESPTNGQFVELFGMTDINHPFPIKTTARSKRDSEGNYVNGGTIEIPFTDRLNEEYVRMVADFRKIIVDFTKDDEAKQKGYHLRYQIRQLEEKEELTDKEQEELKKLYKEHDGTVPERKEFISAYDAVLHMAKNLNEHKAERFKVTGNVNFNYYNGNVQKRFEIQTIEIVTNEQPNGLKVTADLHFAKDAVDKSSFKDEKKLYIDTYVLSYDRDTKKDQFFPLQTVINAEKLDLENERHKAMFNYLHKKFEVKDRKVVNHLAFELKVVRGSEKKEFTLEDCTDEQKEAIAFGWNKVEDFAPKGGAFGDTIEEYRITKPLLKVLSGNDFTNGALESAYEPDDLIYTPPVKDETPTEEVVKDDAPKEEPKMNNLDDELEGLFG